MAARCLILKLIVMKLKLLTAAAALFMFASCGTTYQATDTGTVVVVPESTKQSFMAQYPTSTNIVWTNYDPNVVVLNDWELTGWQVMDVSDYVVRFDMDNENYYAWYDNDGTWIGSAYLVRDHTTLPTAVSSVLNAQFSAYTISSIHREFQKDRIAYEIDLKKSDGKATVLIDKDGNIIKQKVKSY
jgi:hypothetical protein